MTDEWITPVIKKESGFCLFLISIIRFFFLVVCKIMCFKISHHEFSEMQLICSTDEMRGKKYRDIKNRF